MELRLGYMPGLGALAMFRSFVAVIYITRVAEGRLGPVVGTGRGAGLGG
jgi:hypothetical protein